MKSDRVKALALAAAVVAAGGCAVRPETPAVSLEKGQRVFASRDQGHCVLCHAAPGIEVAGNVGPSLAGVGSRLTADQIRERIEDITKIKPDAVMPAFRKIDGQRVAAPYTDRPILTAPQLEDLVAYLASLK
jgi:sulfur-oxidizing protein SoxX